jgi:UDP-3-O-[3-hydroxymyristoyl] glucosamine N-acyltransferase
VVIGSDGFGFATGPATGSHISKPQVGTVHIEDNVQIGANSCVDRAAFGTTRIGQGVRIDNLVMIGHNCVIGENSIIVGQAGIAGSTTLGRNVVLAAQAGVAGHLFIDDGVMAAARSGIHNNQKKGAIIGGAPAFDVKKWGRATAAYSRLPEILREVRRLRKEVDRMSALLNQENRTEKNDE